MWEYKGNESLPSVLGKGHHSFMFLEQVYPLAKTASEP